MAGNGTRSGRRVLAALHRWPFASFILLVILSNLVGSWFNIAYNERLIVRHHLTPAQRDAFWHVMVPAYNLVAYPIGLIVIVVLFLPIALARRGLRAGRPVPPARMDACRRRITRLPTYQVLLNLLLWLPGAVLFPLGIFLIGGWEGAGAITLHFAVSFAISALLTTMQTFFLLEAFLIEVFYPDFFAGARPADVRGSIRVPLPWRLLLFWASVAFAPVVALLAVALNFTADDGGRHEELRGLAAGVAIVGLPSSGFLMWMVGRNLLAWMRAHSAATEAIARGDHSVRIREPRPDEWGILTDRFNDMAEALDRARVLRETFGQFVSPEVRDEILRRHPGLGGEVEDVTVLFADMRGFTRRSLQVPPERSVDVLNRFLSLAVAAVEEKGGWVNKFLGDGFMALFGAPLPRPDHAERALEAARDLVRRLDVLNGELRRAGEEPVQVGVGIHTGPALIGCVGARIVGPDGAERVRRELTAVGETVNLAHRIEQLTKSIGGPILLSAETRSRLPAPDGLEDLGPQAIPGHDGAVALFRAG
jgi:adenylate cyclase